MAQIHSLNCVICFATEHDGCFSSSKVEARLSRWRRTEQFILSTLLFDLIDERINSSFSNPIAISPNNLCYNICYLI